jgi:hypothetical protein
LSPRRPTSWVFRSRLDITPGRSSSRHIRRAIRLLPPAEWRTLDDDERDAVVALSLHIWARSRQTKNAAFEGRDCIFLTVSWMQRLLRSVGARKRGEKAAAAAISFLERRELIVDTGETKKPRRPGGSVAQAEKFQKRGEIVHQGGKEAQPSSFRSYWWRVFRVPALTRIRRALEPQGAYADFEDVPQHLASLSAFLRRQGLISRRSRRSRPNPGSVQWAFAHSGPP